jgi:hypothetical protein
MVLGDFWDMWSCMSPLFWCHVVYDSFTAHMDRVGVPGRCQCGAYWNTSKLQCIDFLAISLIASVMLMSWFPCMLITRQQYLMTVEKWIDANLCLIGWVHFHLWPVRPCSISFMLGYYQSWTIRSCSISFKHHQGKEGSVYFGSFFFNCIQLQSVNHLKSDLTCCITVWQV